MPSANLFSTIIFRSINRPSSLCCTSVASRTLVSREGCATAYAPGTVRNLQSRWKKYFPFCCIYHLNPLPASPFTLSAFLPYLSCTTTSFQFVINQLHSIRILHSCHGFPCDAADSFSIALTKKGLKRIMGARPHQKHPITINLLHQIRSALQVSIPFHAAIWALFLVAFFSFLRKSNLTAPMATSFDPARHLTRSDFKFTPTGAVLRIKWSKTRQHKDGLLLVPLPSIPDCQLCPVSAIRHYFDQVPAPPNAPFFCIPKGLILQPVTAAVFSAAIKRLISHIGSDTSNYSPHSFRCGGATFAFQSGVPDHLIKLHGDWRSDAYQAYNIAPLYPFSSRGHYGIRPLSLR